MPTQRALIAMLVAMLVAIGGGHAMIRHAGRMLHEGVSLEEGGGWTALILAEFVVAMAGVGVALA